MCGIVGILASGGRRPDDAEVVQRMLDSIRHRGPDDGGIWADPAAGLLLGSRRLAVQDLSPHGHMPMVSRSGRRVITYNGEIYNAPDLRNELEAAGCVFRGHSDTEVLLAAVEAWGLDATLARIVGMFAFALWDVASRTLHLVRDRVGEKPLYWTSARGRVAFASELRAFRALDGWNSSVDRAALASYLTLGYVPAPASIFEGTRKVPPGSVLTVSADGVVTEAQYWLPRAGMAQGQQASLNLPEVEIDNMVEHALKRSVSQQLVADVPVGAFLSGGVDSSLVVALMQESSSSPARTFSVGFHEEDYDEAPYARRIAHYLGTQHNEIIASPDEVLATIPEMPTIYDEPFADPSQVPTFMVARLAKQSVTVALTGDGGDELFAGYRRYGWGMRAWSRTSMVPLPVRRAIARIVINARPGLWNQAAESVGLVLPQHLRAPLLEPKLRHVASLLCCRDHREFYHRQLAYTDKPPMLESGQRTWQQEIQSGWAHGQDPLRSMMADDLVSYLPDDILVKVDRATMAVSLESRAPFLDHRLIELSWRIPRDHVFSAGAGKLNLRRILARRVPLELFDRPKMGFGMPIDRWLRGPLHAWAHDLLESSTLLREGYLDASQVNSALRQHEQGTHDHSYLLWSTLMFQAWLRHGQTRSPHREPHPVAQQLP